MMNLPYDTVKLCSTKIAALDLKVYKNITILMLIIFLNDAFK